MNKNALLVILALWTRQPWHRLLNSTTTKSDQVPLLERLHLLIEVANKKKLEGESNIEILCFTSLTVGP